MYHTELHTYLNSKILKLLSSRFRLFDMVWRDAWSCLLLAMIFFIMHFTMGPETILGIKKINFIIKYEKIGLLTDVWFMCVSCHFGRSSNWEIGVEIGIECQNIYRISSYSFRPWIVSAHLCTVTFGLMHCDLWISKFKKE